MSSRHSFAREFNRSQISKVIPVSGPPPETDPYQRDLAAKFANWRLTVDGLVARPTSFSLDELKRFPSRTDITHPHGAPLRLRVPRQLGYKSIKYLSRITLTDSLKHVGDGRGSSEPAAGYSWFAGI